MFSSSSKPKRFLVDIKRPDFDYDHIEHLQTIDLRDEVRSIHSQRSPFVLGVRIAFGLIVFSTLLLYLVFFRTSHTSDPVQFSEAEIQIITSQFSDALNAVQRFDLEEARKILDANVAFISRISPSPFFQSVLSFLPLDRTQTLSEDFMSFNRDLLRFTVVLEELRVNLFRYLQDDPDALLSHVSELRDTSSYILSTNESLRNRFLSFPSSTFLSDTPAYLLTSIRFREWNSFFDEVASLLQGDETHILLLIHDSEVLRPGGGVIRAFGDLVLNGGVFSGVKFYSSSFVSSTSLKAPDQLLLAAPNWHARDGAWFSHVPMSVDTTLSLLQGHSELGSRSFDLVLNISSEFLSDLLSITGPIRFEEAKITVDSESITTFIREERAIPMSELVSFLFFQVSRFDPVQYNNFLDLLEQHASSRSISAVSFLPATASFLSRSGFDGGSFSPPYDFWGYSLGVTFANILGFPTDFRGSQKVSLQLSVDSDGGVLSDIELSYAPRTVLSSRITPKGGYYVQFSTPLRTLLTSMKGGGLQPFTPRWGFSAPTTSLVAVQEMERETTFSPQSYTWTSRTSDGTFFGTWVRTSRSPISSLYFRNQVVAPPQLLMREGEVFRFVFEPQVGVVPALSLQIRAPIGYKWKESGSPIFVYSEEKVLGRKTLQLTLGK